MIADLAGDRTTFAPGTAEFIDNDPTLAGIGVFSDPISGYLLITPVNGTADGSFSLADNYGLPSNNSITRDNALDGSLGKSLKYTLTAATADNIKTVINNLKYTAPTAGERSFSVILNNGTASSEAVGFSMIGNGDGACGTANATSAPSANLCATGTATPVTGNGPWNWSRAGSGTGDNATCSASVTAAPPSSGGNYTPPPTSTTLPTGGGTATLTGGQSVEVSDNGKDGTAINLPPPSTGTTGTNPGSNSVNVTLPGTGKVGVSSDSSD